MSTSWVTINQTDDPEEGFGQWTIDDQESLNSRAERNAWNVNPRSVGIASVLNRSNLSALQIVSKSAPNWGNWDAEEFAFTPEQLDIFPEDTQADAEGWSLQPEPS